MAKEDDGTNTLGNLFKGISSYINLVLIAVAFLVNYGMFRSDYSHLQKQIEDLEALKPEQIKWVQDQQTLQLTNLTTEQRSVQVTISEMKTKIDVIAEWVHDQKDHKELSSSR